MSSPTDNNTNKDGGQPQPTPVVQTILESFTRCFNPIDVGCSKITNDSAASSSNRKRSSPTNQLIGLNISSGSRAVSRSTSSNDSRKKKLLLNNMSYDADSVAKAKKSANSKISVEAMEERSMKRKLEIFRGASSDSANNRSGPKLAPRLSQQPTVRTSPLSSREPSPTNLIKNATAAETGQLALSDDEEELIRLQQSRKRFACGMNIPDRMAQTGSPVSGIASLFRQAQKPFGLCFATPVRTASNEDVDNFSDDKLTYDEFLCRHPLAGATDKNVPQVSPEAQQDNNSSYNEEETITSTLYFDQKYSHVVQTRPPMPLFQENMLEDELLSKFIPKSKSNPPEFVGQSPRRKSRGSPKTVTSGRGSPKSPKQGGGRGSPKSGKRSPKNIFSMSDPPSPIKIQDDSVIMNTSQSGESMVITTDFTEDPQEPQCDVVLQPPTTAEF